MTVEDQSNLDQRLENETPQPIIAVHEAERSVPNQMVNESSKKGRRINKRGKTLVIVSSLLVLAFIVLLSRGVSFFSFGRPSAVPLGNTSPPDIALVTGSVEKFNF